MDIGRLSVLTFLFLVLAMAILHVNARPSQGKTGSTAAHQNHRNGRSQYRHKEKTTRAAEYNECESSSSTRELCQRCAKATKAIDAYSWCCTNVSGSKDWCRSFLSFGISANNIDNLL